MAFDRALARRGNPHVVCMWLCTQKAHGSASLSGRGTRNGGGTGGELPTGGPPYSREGAMLTRTRHPRNRMIVLPRRSLRVVNPESLQGPVATSNGIGLIVVRNCCLAGNEG